MKFTLSWLSSFVSFDLSPLVLADKLTMLGLEVEQVVSLSEGLDKIIVARVVDVKKHPNADRLSLCAVDKGDEVVSVVCGAPNVRAGLLVAMALPGAVMADGMKIKKAKVRGEKSMGMICSQKELGIGDGHDGIFELPGKHEPGTQLVDALELDDVMIEVDLTPNRSDCASVLGIAREVAALSGSRVSLPVVADKQTPTSDQDFSVEIKAVELCSRYAAQKVENVKIAPSPWWLQRQLLAVGMRPVNNVVDVTNFVMLEYGQPLHAFDYDTLEGSKIVVRCPVAGEEKFTTLDGVERELTEDTLLICDGRGPVAIAGVMGGLDSEVTDETCTVLLESACFDPISIRKTAKRLKLPSEASYRFERGVDPDVALHALARATALLQEVAGGVPSNGVIDLYPGKKERLVLDLRVSRVNAISGLDLEQKQIADYLAAIEFGVDCSLADVVKVEVPGFRPDIEREIDLIEEVVRLFGYDNVPTTMPDMQMESPAGNVMRDFRTEVANIFLAGGFAEVVNYSFTSVDNVDKVLLSESDRRRDLVKLLNPLSEDQAVLRSMLLPTMLENVSRNINFQNLDIKIFEIGKVFRSVGADKQPEERYQLCAVCSGERYPLAESLYFSGKKADFFDLKGLAESLLRELRLDFRQEKIEFVDSGVDTEPYAEQGMGVHIKADGKNIGFVALLAKEVAANFSIKQPVWFLEIDLDEFGSLAREKVVFKPLPRYPQVKRDIALLVPESVRAGELLRTILAHKNKENLIEEARLFDVYKGKSVESGMKSVAISVSYRAKDRTLDDKTVDELHEKIVNSLMEKFAARYRDGK